MRVYERDPAAIKAWKRDTYPNIAARAKRLGAEIYFWDESGFRADAVQGRTWGVKGQTPIVAVPGKRQSVSAASAVNAKGAFWFTTYKGGMSADLFVAMLKQIMRRRRKPLFLVIDSLPAHKAKTRARLCRGDRWQTEIVLPARLCAGIEPGRTGMELHEAHRYR